MPCVDDEAYKKYAQDRKDAMIKYATLDVAIGAALALYKRNSSGAIADLQADLGNRQFKLAEKIREHAKKFWPYEDAFVNDAFGEPKAVPQYQALSLQYGSYVDDALRKGRTVFLGEMKRKCISVTDCEDNLWKRGHQLIKADMISHADRQAEGREEALNDKRYARQYAALGLGRQYLGQIPSFQALSGAAQSGPRNALIGTIQRGWQLWGAQRVPEDPWGRTAQQKYDYLPYPYDKQQSYDEEVVKVKDFLRMGRDLEAGVASMRATVSDMFGG